MRYKRYHDEIPCGDMRDVFMYNRGIDYEDQDVWYEAGFPDRWCEDYIYEPRWLNRDGKLDRAKAMVERVIEYNEDICVVVDCDVDGLSSASLLINYIGRMNPVYAAKHIQAIHHEGKVHGLGDTVYEVLAMKNVGLCVCPDGASNDEREHKLLNDAGIDILVLDHHECTQDYSNEHTCIVNIQISEYPNKALTGSGVTWQFCRYLDECYGTQYADDLVDLAALGAIGDMADYREVEIRALVSLGLSRISNPLVSAMFEKNKYIYEKHHKGYLGIAFSIVPFINAVTRSGTMEEKEFVFNSMLERNRNVIVESSKRGETGIQVSMADDAVTILDRVKRRQTKDQDEMLERVESIISEKSLTDNAVIAVVLGEDDCRSALCGLLANKIQAKYQHPAMLLRDTGDSYTGSLRNYSMCEDQDFAAKCRATGIPNYVAGHANAAGISIPADKFAEFIEATNESYSDIDFTPSYWVDFIWQGKSISPSDVMSLGSVDYLCGQGMPVPQVAVENITLSPTNVTLMGKNRNTIKVTDNNVSYIIFGADEDVYNKFISDPNLTLTVVGEPNVNEWQGTHSAQVIVNDYELTECDSTDEDGYWVF